MTTNTSRAIAALALAISATLTPAVAHADSPQEDDPGWSCVDSGNRVCGPLSDDWGHTPGCYDDGGVLFAEWPCTAWTPADGYRHADGTVTR